MADCQRSPQQQQQQKQRPTTEAVRGLPPEKGPSTQQIIAVVTLLPLGGFFLLLSGLTFFGSLISLTVSAPLFLLFSPVLVPAAILIFLAVAGFLTSGAFGIAGLSSLTWLANFVRGIFRARLPEQVEQAKRLVQDTVGNLGQRARATGQTTAQEVVKGEEGGKAQDGKKMLTAA